MLKVNLHFLPMSVNRVRGRPRAHWNSPVVDKARLKAKPLKAQWTVPNVDGRIPFPLMEAPDFSGASMRNFSISLLSPAFLISQ
jgi:hypothetical protein